MSEIEHIENFSPSELLFFAKKSYIEGVAKGKQLILAQKEINALEVENKRLEAKVIKQTSIFNSFNSALNSIKEEADDI